LYSATNKLGPLNLSPFVMLKQLSILRIHRSRWCNTKQWGFGLFFSPLMFTYLQIKIQVLSSWNLITNNWQKPNPTWPLIWLQFNILKMKWFWRFAIVKSKEKFMINSCICIFLFHSMAYNNKWLKNCNSYLKYSHIQLNLPRDDHHFFYILKITKHKFLTKAELNSHKGWSYPITGFSMLVATNTLDTYMRRHYSWQGLCLITSSTMLVTVISLNPHTSPLFKASLMSDNRLQCMSGYHEQSSHSQAWSSLFTITCAL
jgi:hypothetical protein